MMNNELPKVISDILLQIAKKVATFNKAKSRCNILAKTDSENTIVFFPDKYETLFFSIHKYELLKLDEKSNFLKPYFYVAINYDSIKTIKETFIKVEGLPFSGRINDEHLLDLFEMYLETINDLYLEISKLEKVDLNFTEIFPIVNYQSNIVPEPSIFKKKENILPYSIKQFSIINYNGVLDLQQDNIPVDSQWIFLVGENGFGKTSILQSVFLGLNGTSDGNVNLLDSKNTLIQLEYKSNEVSHINNTNENKNPLIHIAAYGPGRLNLQGAASENAEDRNSSVSYNLFNSDGFLFNINAELVKWALKNDKKFDLLKKAFCTLIPNLADIRFNKETDQIEYIEQEIGTTNDTKVTYQPLPFQKLASGFKSIIALAGDIIVRLSKNQKEAKDPSDLAGIVLIDEIDLHLHPKFQKQLIGSFSKVFPKIQFIVSTHSPIPLLGAPENSIIFKVTRTKAEGVQIEEVIIDLKNLTPNLVLTSGIFDMEDFVSVQNKDITQVRTEDSFEEMKHNDEVERYLKDFEKSDKNFPDELFLSKSK